MTVMHAALLLLMPLVLLLTFKTPRKQQWIPLLIVSCAFYASFVPIYLIALLSLVLIDFVAGLMLAAPKRSVFARKMILTISLISNVGMLATFRYWREWHLLVGPSTTWTDLIMPIGLSFHTFQSMAYTIEVYRRRVKAERHLGYYALFVMFFPQLLAGPIERPQHLIPQLRRGLGWDTDRVFSGSLRVMFGLVKKLIVADQLGVFVDSVFSAPSNVSSSTLWLAMYAFAFQILADFSGYTDIALGLARMLGIELSENFDRPYQASSLKEFWSRWHITLSTWFRDYVYIPLGGSRKSKLRTICNLVLTFALAGLWHGANLTYLVWGLMHAVGRSLELFTSRRAPRSLNVFLTFNFVALAFVIFRSPTLTFALSYFEQMFGLTSQRGPSEGTVGIGLTVILINIAFVFVWQLFEASRFQKRIESLGETPSFKLRALTLQTLLITLVLYLALSTHSAKTFIYFQF